MAEKPKIIFGAPSRDRAWALPNWFDHIYQAVPEGYDSEVAILLPENDITSIDIANEFGATVLLKDEEPLEYKRKWNEPGIFQKMSSLRNELLRYVREQNPTFYCSVDTDIFIHPDSISSMIDTYQNHECNAVGGLTYLTFSDRLGVNCGFWNNHLMDGYRRGPDHGIYPVDILMAYKLMDDKAYNVDYSSHRYGEDLGWSANIKREGLKLHFDASYPSKHVMYRERVNEVDKRCGY